MKDSLELLNEIAKHRDKVREHAELGEVEQAKYESGIADTLQNQLVEAINYEREQAAKRPEDLVFLGGDEQKKKKPKKTMAELVLGPKDQFQGLSRNDSIRVPVDYAVDLPDPVTIETGYPTTTVEPAGFLGTIGRGTTDSTSNTFPQRAPGTNRLVLPTWRRGERKEEFGLQWKQSTFYTEWIAGMMTVSEVTLKNYGMLENIMRTELYNGLERAQHYYAVHGNPPEGENGIVGILNPKAGVPAFDKTKFEGDTILDTLKRMATRVVMQGHAPSVLCVQPLFREYLDLLKVGEGRNDYLGLTINGSVWGLRIVDDVYFADFDDDATVKNAYAMVYDPAAATWFTQHGPEFVMERMGEQLAYNETTMRLEGAYGLKIADPTAFMTLKFEVSDMDTDMKDYLAPRPRPKSVEVVKYDPYTEREIGIAPVELGDFALSGTSLYGEANLVTVPKFGLDEEKDGWFVMLRAPEGTTVKKDGTGEKTLDADGIWGVRLGKKSEGKITAKKLSYTIPGQEEKTLNIKVTALKGSAHQGGRVRQS